MSEFVIYGVFQKFYEDILAGRRADYSITTVSPRGVNIRPKDPGVFPESLDDIFCIGEFLSGKPVLAVKPELAKVKLVGI